MPDSLPDDLVDRIYEAAAIPELWRDVLAKIVDFSEAATGSLFAFNAGVTQWIGNPAAEVLISDFVSLGRPGFNSRIARDRGVSRFGFVTDHDIFRPDEIDHDPFYRDFLHPRGYGWMASTSFQVPTGDQIYVSIGRERRRGHFERPYVDALDTLRPHLGRAAFVAARIGFERARAMVNVLESIGLPAALLKPDGRLFTANRSFDELVPQIVQDRRDRVGLADEAADALLSTALTRTAHAGHSRGGRSIPLAASQDRPPMIFHLLPVTRAAHDIFFGAACLLVATAVVARAVPAPEVLAGLFDFTPAEAKVAQAIASGSKTERIASEFGISKHTVRGHIKAALTKTGLHRQTELAHLLAGLAVPKRPTE